MKYVCIFFAFVIMTSSLSAQEREMLVSENNSSSDLQILSWNIYMLPGITNFSKRVQKSSKRVRAKAIADWVLDKNYTIIVFQEAFFCPARKLLAKHLKEAYPYQYGPANPSGISLKTNSGIWVVSNIPLRTLGSVQYESCNGADCWAKKGAYLLEGEWEGTTFQVLGTHLNAGGPQWIREEQYLLMWEALIQPYQKMGVPQFLCGDFNTNMSNIENYTSMLNVLDAENEPTHGTQKYTADGKKCDMNRGSGRSVIDYILHRENGTDIIFKDKQVVMPKHRWSENHEDLSDHFGMSIAVNFSRASYTNDMID